MDRPYGISDFAFPTRWDRESGPDLVEKAGRSSQRDREHGQAERDTGPDSARSYRAFDRARTIYRGRDREYSLRASEVRTLTDIGKFRVVPADDLARFGYQGNRTQMESDARSLTRQGLVEQRTIEGHSSYSTKVLTLTKDGQRLLKRAQLVSNRQATYHGLVKPKEARHDADLYRLYQKVAREIERSGGKVRRVVLDFELKKDLYQALSRMRPDKDPRYERIFIANEFDLKVVDGKIPIPDLRIARVLHIFAGLRLGGSAWQCGPGELAKDGRHGLTLQRRCYTRPPRSTFRGRSSLVASRERKRCER